MLRLLIKYIGIITVVLFPFYTYAQEVPQVIDAIPVIYQGNQGFLIKLKPELSRMPKTVRWNKYKMPIDIDGEEIDPFVANLYPLHKDVLNCKGNYLVCGMLKNNKGIFKFLLNESSPKLIGGNSKVSNFIYIDNLAAVKPGDDLLLTLPYFLIFENYLDGTINLCSDIFVGDTLVKHNENTLVFFNVANIGDVSKVNKKGYRVVTKKCGGLVYTGGGLGIKFDNNLRGEYKQAVLMTKSSTLQAEDKGLATCDNKSAMGFTLGYQIAFPYLLMMYDSAKNRNGIPENVAISMGVMDVLDGKPKKSQSELMNIIKSIENDLQVREPLNPLSPQITKFQYNMYLAQYDKTYKDVELYRDKIDKDSLSSGSKCANALVRDNGAYGILDQKNLCMSNPLYIKDFNKCKAKSEKN